MREIKFKIWSTAQKRMMHNYTIQDIANRSSHMDIDNSDYIWDPKGDYYVPNIIEGLVFLEYTGIKDVHGNEIYEGDVISYREEDNALLSGEVRMRDGAFCVMGMIIAKMEFKLVYLHDIKVPVRIIGNGYEGMSSFRGGDNEGI